MRVLMFTQVFFQEGQWKQGWPEAVFICLTGWGRSGPESVDLRDPCPMGVGTAIFPRCQHPAGMFFHL